MTPFLINENSKELIAYLDNPKKNIINNDNFEYLKKLNKINIIFSLFLLISIFSLKSSFFDQLIKYPF